MQLFLRSRLPRALESFLFEISFEVAGMLTAERNKDEGYLIFSMVGGSE